MMHFANLPTAFFALPLLLTTRTKKKRGAACSLAMFRLMTLSFNMVTTLVTQSVLS